MKMGLAGRSIIEERFTIQQAAAQYAEIYRRILRGI
jgi:glycosyltransferase involved in cell wall biosynthesis